MCVGTLAAPPLAHPGLGWLCLSRVIVGLGEGFAPSAVTNIIARSIPERERSRAVATVFGGLDVGSVIGLLLCGPLIQQYGWPSVFTIFGTLGLVWAMLWPLLIPDQLDPEMIAEQKLLDEQQAMIRAESGHQASIPDEDLPVRPPV